MGNLPDYWTAPLDDYRAQREAAEAKAEAELSSLLIQLAEKLAKESSNG